MVAAPVVMPSVADATGLATLALSAWVFTTTATGWFDDTVTAYCLLSVRPGAPRAMSSESGSIGLALPGSIVRGMTMVGPVPSNDLKLPVTDAVDDPRFWMMNGVSKRPKNFRVMFGRYTVFAPVVNPSYDSAS